MVKEILTVADVVWSILFALAPIWSKPSRSYYTLATLMIITLCGSVFYMWN